MNRRARPLLGTFVEISAWGGSIGAVDRAFEAIQVLQKKLSYHDPASELSHLNDKAFSMPVCVRGHLGRLLGMALRLARLSGGAFDPTAGSHGASWRDIELLPGSRVRFRRALRLDLGGIAKGYCVDRAVAELRRCGVESGLVNAGGDLRAFGPRAFPLQVRHPQDLRQRLPLGELRDAALATSATYLRGQERCAGSAPVAPGVSVSVRAPRAALADALTKVVAVMGAGAAPLLARHGARAWIVGEPMRAAA
jgi:thiamine biosynthesis lipoprotein